MPGREIRLIADPRKFVPRADELAIVAAENPVADRCAELDRDRAFELDC